MITPERLRGIVEDLADGALLSAKAAAELLQHADELERAESADADLQLDHARLMEHARKVRGRSDVHSVYEVLDWAQKRIAELEAALDRIVRFVDRSHASFPDVLMKAEAMGECAAASEVYHANNSESPRS